MLPSGGVSIKTGRFNGVKSGQEIYHKDYGTDCDFLTDVLMINGVPERAILREDKSAFTKENAYFSRRVTDEGNLRIKKAILCCKNFHARRALMCYQFAFPDTEFIVCPVPYSDHGTEIAKDSWFQTEAGVKRVLGELLRYGKQFEKEFETLR